MTDFIQIRLLVLMFAGWISREQASAIAYLVEKTGSSKSNSRPPGSACF